MRRKTPILLALSATALLASCGKKPGAAPDPAATDQAAAQDTATTRQAQPDPTDRPAPEAPPAPDSLKPGDKVTLQAVQAATWIQGEAPSAFEPGHVYIFECWATWCGPCIRSIPHLNKLHKEYADKGLHLHGIHIFERGEAGEALEKATAFVSKQGEEMQYPVAFAARDSMFASHWIKPAKVRGIPHAFIVVDGVLKMMTHPARIDGPLIEALLKGGEEAEQKIKALQAATGIESSLQSAVRDFRRAAMEGDPAKMETLLATIKKGQVPPQVVDTLEVDLILAKKDMDSIKALIQEQNKGVRFNYLCSRTGMPGTLKVELPDDLLGQLATGYAGALASRDNVQAMEWLSLSGLQFRAGDKAKSVESAKAAEQAATAMPKQSRLPASVFTKFRESVENGSLPEGQEFTSWLRGGSGPTGKTPSGP